MTVIEDRIPSNFFALSAGIIPSKEFSTHTHLAFNLAQMALPKSMSKPTSLLSGVLYSKGAYADSVPKRMVFHSFAWTVLLSATATNVVESSNFFASFSF